MAKSFYSPYSTVMDTALDEVEGVIDYVKCTGGAGAGTAVITMTDNHGNTNALKVKTGDSLYGPFTKAVYTTIETDMVVSVHERSKIITS